MLHACMHPRSSSCTVGAGQFFLSEMPNALRVYVPLNILLALIFRRNQMVSKCVLRPVPRYGHRLPARRGSLPVAGRARVSLARSLPLACCVVGTRRRRCRPGTFLWRTATSSMRSSIFLATYCTVSLLVPCYMRDLLGNDYAFSYARARALAPAPGAPVPHVCIASHLPHADNRKTATPHSSPKDTTSTGSWAACPSCSSTSRGGSSWPCTALPARSSRFGTAWPSAVSFATSRTSGVAVCARERTHSFCGGW